MIVREQKHLQNRINRRFLTNRKGHRRLLSIGVSALLSISTFLMVIPQTETTVYAEDSKTIVLVNNGAAPNITGEQTSSVYFGNFFQSGKDGGGYNNDPIKWRVLRNSNGQLFLLADQNLVVKRYNETYRDVTWETCTLRGWLNGLKRTEAPAYDYTGNNDNFIGTAFAPGEQRALAITTNSNPLYPGYYSGGVDTEDKVFLLSVPEVNNTGYGFTDQDSRKGRNTKYVADGNTTNGSMYGEGVADLWWLRSPGFLALGAAVVERSGDVYTSGHGVDHNFVAVRPAFNLNLSSIILTSAAEGGKNPATAGTLEAPATYSGTEWKLTLLDSGLTVGHGNLSRSGSTVTVPYTCSGTGINRISVLITDKAYTASDAEIKYYGKLSINGDIGTSGTGTFSLPSDYDTSWKVYILSEVINDDKKTDYASVPASITIPDASGEPVSKEKSRPVIYRKHSGNGGSVDETNSKPAAVNPDTVEGYFTINGQMVSGVAMGKTKQGVAAQAVFNANRPVGWQEAFTFNMAINGKVDYTLKNGVLTIIIPKEYQKAGRTFAIMALDKSGKAWTFADTDTNPATVTANINVEGYAFALVYKD